MTLAELIAAARVLADDSTTQSLWTDAELTLYINEAEREVARRLRCLLDSTSADDGATPTPAPLCVVPVTAGDTFIALHPKILFVRKVKLDSQELPLSRAHVKDLDFTFPTWEEDTEGDTMVYVPNWENRKLRFYFPIQADDTVRLRVVRLPLADMAANDDVPEVDPLHHMSMLSWVLYRMYLKPDEETEDKAKAKDALAMFENEFGARSSAIDETWIQREHGYDDHEGIY